MGKKEFGLKIFLISAVCFAAIFNLETSPFKYLIPAFPFSECPNNQLAGDTYVYLYTGGLIPQGLMPYRDVFDHKGPLLYLIMALGISIGRVAGVWLIQSILLFVSAFFAYRTARLLAGRSAAALASVLAVTWCSLGETGPDTFAVPFLLISLWHMTRYLYSGYRIGGGAVFLTGICFASVALMKMNLTAFWLVYIAAVIVISLVRGEYTLLLKRTVLFLLGAFLTAGSVLYWLYVKGALTGFIADYLVFNLRGYGESPPCSNYLVYFCPVVFRHSMSALVHWVLYFWFNTPALLVYLFLARGKNVPRRILCACMAIILLLTIWLIGAKGWIFIYYCLPMTAVYLPFFAFSFDYILRLGPRRRVAAVVLFLLLSAPVLYSLCIPAVRDWGKRQIAARFFPNIDLGQFGVPMRFDRSALDTARFLRESSAEDARISGSGFDIYWYAHRRCANIYPFLLGKKYQSDRQQLLTPFRPPSFLPAQKSYELTFPEDAEGNPPEFIFVRRRENLRLGKHLLSGRGARRMLETSPEIEKRLADEYALVYQNDCFDIYRQKGR